MDDAHGLKLLLNKVISDIEKIDTRSYVMVETTARAVTDIEGMRSQMNKIVPIVEDLQKHSILSSKEIQSLKEDVQKLNTRLSQPDGLKDSQENLRMLEAETNRTRWGVAAKVAGVLGAGAYIIYRLIEELLQT